MARKGIEALRRGIVDSAREGLHHEAEHKTSHPAIQNPSHPPEKIRTLETAYRELPEKNVFHPYKKTGFLGRLSRKIERHGYPPLPIIALVGIIVFAAILPLISSAIFFTEPREIDVYVAIYSQKGEILRDVSVILASPDYSKIERSAVTQKDGLAYFKLLPVNAKYAVYAEKRNGERINLEERELKVPFPRGRSEIIIEIRAVG
ncbi:MAG: hypothetical protein AABX01_02640 [Candidatus Micrarchaeota archaeon]